MNYGRLVAAAVVATIVDMVYGFFVYGMGLTKQFAAYPAIFREPAAQVGYTPWMIAGIFVAMTAATFIYAKGYEGGSGIGEGIRFGCCVGVFVVGYVWLVNYSMMNIGRRLTGSMAVAEWVAWLIVGAVIGVVYRPKIAVNVKPAAV